MRNALLITERARFRPLDLAIGAMVVGLSYLAGVLAGSSSRWILIKVNEPPQCTAVANSTVTTHAHWMRKAANDVGHPVLAA